jgi:Fe-S-cluster-containing dehydrogenase component
MNYAMALDYQSCINCRACETACKQENGVQLGADKQRIWVGVVEGVTHGRPFSNFYPSQCNHCIDAPCVSVCPTHASHFSEGGIVKVDFHKCILCKGCMLACPYDARFVDDIVVAVDKCTFCDHRIDEYGTTACQSVCPTSVRTFGDLDDENSDLVKLLKKKKFFFQKESLGVLPKLFYILPDSIKYARQSVGRNVKVHTWDEIMPKYTKANERRSKEWRS